MIALNKKTNKVFVAFDNTTYEEFAAYKEAILEIIHKGDCIPNVSERALYNALQLVEALTPSVDQQVRGMENEEDYKLVEVSLSDSNTAL